MTSCIVTDSDRCVGIVFRICLTGEKNTNSSQVANFGGELSYKRSRKLLLNMYMVECI